MSITDALMDARDEVQRYIDEDATGWYAEHGDSSERHILDVLDALIAERFLSVLPTDAS